MKNQLPQGITTKQLNKIRCEIYNSFLETMSEHDLYNFNTFGVSYLYEIWEGSKVLRTWVTQKTHINTASLRTFGFSENATATLLVTLSKQTKCAAYVHLY
jgi:hypothetical protein